MKVRINININRDRPPYIERIYKGSELVSKSPANVLAYYDVTLCNSGKVSIFSVTKRKKSIDFEECDYVFSDNDEPLWNYLNEIEIDRNKIDDIMELVINKIVDLFNNQKSSALLEIET